MLKKQCIICGKIFTVKDKKGNYCSDHCKYLVYSHKVCKIYIYNCSYCGKGYITTNVSSKYCSNSCEYSMLNQGAKSKIYYSNCKKCDKLIVSRYNNQSFCSRDCQTTYVDDKGINSNSDEVTRYVAKKVNNLIRPVLTLESKCGLNYYNISGFSDSVKLKVLERDKYECQTCLCNYGLEVHHIIPRILGGSHDESNLITLCSSCHRAIETRDIDYAIKKCTKNYLTKSEKSFSEVDYETLVKKIDYKLSKLFTQILHDVDCLEDEKNDILIEIDDIITYC